MDRGCRARKRHSSQGAHNLSKARLFFQELQTSHVGRLAYNIFLDHNAACFHNSRVPHTFFRTAGFQSSAVSKQIPVLQRAHWCDLLWTHFFLCHCFSSQNQILGNAFADSLFEKLRLLWRRQAVANHWANFRQRSAKDFRFHALPPRFWREKGLAERCACSSWKPNLRSWHPRPSQGVGF